MNLPPELVAPPPRSAAAAEVFLAKTKKRAYGLLGGGALCFPLVLVIFWLNFEELNQAGIFIALGISGLVELLAVALLINTRKSLQLFREGIATVGRISRVTATEGTSYVVIEVQYLGPNGTQQVGTAVTVGNADGMSVREGLEVAVLSSLTDPRRFAIYTPALGMTAGMVKGG